MTLLFAASGEFALPTLRALLASDHKILQVISQPDRPSGRGRRLAPTPVSQFALEKNLPLLRTHNINAEPLPPADLMIVIAFGQKISPAIVHHPRLGSINLHASLLPKYRGAAPINHALLHGETVTGNSIIRLADKMDAGAILAQSHVDVAPLETAGELHDRLAEDGAPLVLKTLVALESGRAVESPQDESQATLAPKLTRESTNINWNQDAQSIANQIRGLYPWPGCRVELIDPSGKSTGRLTLVRARRSEFNISSPTPPDSPIRNFVPGQIERRHRTEVINGHSCHIRVDMVGSAEKNAAVEILEVQPEGKQPMTLDAYRNGHAWEPGYRLQSI